MKLPKDILNTVEKQFGNDREKDQVLALLLTLWNRNLNVGPAQLARSVLVLAGSDPGIVKDLFENHFEGDPRDVVSRANTKTEGRFNYFIAPLE